MTIKELKDRLSRYPDDAEVVVDCEEYGDCVIYEVRPSCGREGEIEKLKDDNTVVIDCSQW